MGAAAPHRGDRAARRARGHRAGVDRRGDVPPLDGGRRRVAGDTVAAAVEGGGRPMSSTTTGRQPDMTTTTATTEAAAAADPRRWKALAVLALIQFMLILDVTVVNVALPQIQDDLGFSRAGLLWVVNGTVLMAGGMILLGGRMADIFGRRKLFLIGVALFAVASAARGAAVGPRSLVAAAV